MRTKALMLFILSAFLLMAAAPAVHAAGCCQTRSGCFGTDSEAFCTVFFKGIHYQLGVCMNGKCEPTAAGTPEPAEPKPQTSTATAATPWDGADLCPALTASPQQ